MSFVTHLYDLKLKHMDKTITEKFAELEGLSGIGDLSSIQTQINALINPVDASFNITTPAGNVEVGTILSSVVFSYSIANFNNIKSAQIYNVTGSELIATLVAESGNVTKSITLQRTSPGTYTFRLDIVDANDKEITIQRSINWYWATYSGNSSSPNLNAAEIKALTKTLKSSYSGNYTIANSTGYKYIAYPKPLGLVSSFKDSVTGFVVGMEEPIETTIVNDEGITVVMYVYRTTQILSGAITIVAA